MVDIKIQWETSVLVCRTIFQNKVQLTTENAVPLTDFASLAPLPSATDVLPSESSTHFTNFPLPDVMAQ